MSSLDVLNPIFTGLRCSRWALACIILMLSTGQLRSAAAGAQHESGGDIGQPGTISTTQPASTEDGSSAFEATLKKARERDFDAAVQLREWLTEGKLSKEEIHRTIECALEQQRLDASEDTYPVLMRLISGPEFERAATAEQLDRYYKQAVVLLVDVRPEVRQGDPFPLRFRVVNRIYGRIDFELRGLHVCVDGQPAIEDEALVSSEWLFYLPLKPGDLHDETASRTIDLAAHRSSQRIDFAALKPGRHTVECRTTIAVYDPYAGWRGSWREWAHSSVHDVDILPVNAPLPVSAARAEDMKDMFKDAISIEAVQYRKSGDEDSQVRICSPLQDASERMYAVVGGAYDVVIAYGGREIRCGEFVFSGQCMTPNTPCTPWTPAPDLNAERVDVILRPNPTLALSTVDLFEIPAGDIAYQGVALDRRTDVERLVDLVRNASTDDTVRKKALVALESLDLDEATILPVLEQALESSNPVVGATAVRVLRKLGVAAIPGLTKALMHEDVLVYADALDALEDLGDDAIPAYVAGLGSSCTNDLVRDKCRLELRYRIEKAEPALRAALDGDDAIRAAEARDLLDRKESGGWLDTISGWFKGDEDADPLGEEGEPAYTEEEARVLIEELIPLVEQAAGRTFKQPPTWQIASRTEVVDALYRDLHPQIQRLMPSASASDIDRTVASQAHMLSRVLLGKYGLEDHTLYLVPGNVSPLMELGKSDERFTKDLIRLTVAHELTHALQDQYIGLATSMASITDIERGQAFNATIEGHAVFVQDRIAETLDIEESAAEFARLISAGAIELEDPAAELISNVVDTVYEQIYLAGRDFMAYHFEHGGVEKMWSILAAPPKRTSMIVHPETYSPDAPGRPDYASMLEGLEERFGAESWTVTNTQIGPIMLRAAYAALEPDKQEKLLDCIDDAQALIVQQAVPAMMGNVSIMRLSDGCSSDWVLDTLEGLARKNVEELRSSDLITVGELHIEDVTTPGGARGRRVAFTIEQPVGDTNIVAIRHIRNGVIFDVVAVNLELSYEQLGAIIDEVCVRYDELLEAVPSQ